MAVPVNGTRNVPFGSASTIVCPFTVAVTVAGSSSVNASVRASLIVSVGGCVSIVIANGICTAPSASVTVNSALYLPSGSTAPFAVPSQASVCGPAGSSPWNGARLADGKYAATLTVSDALGDVQFPLPLSIDTTAPVLTLLDARTLRFSLSEPATVTVLVDGQTRLVHGEPKGAFTVPYAGAVTQVSAQAQDAAGNTSAPVTG